jgi:transketolase
MRDAFIKTLLAEAKHNPEIFLITGDLGFGVIEDFQKALPNQFINAGVSEQAMMGIAAGIASTGKRVFVYSIGNFPTLRCLEQIRNDVCLMNNPVVIVSVGAGYSYGSQGYTHHALEDIAVMRALPNMQIFVPADSIEAVKLTKYLANSRNPSYLRLGRSGEPEISKIIDNKKINEIVEISEGSDGTILFVGPIGSRVLAADKIIRSMNKSASVASVPFVSALDLTFLRKAAKKGPIVTVEEHSSRGGFGSLILETLNSEGINCKVKIVAAKQYNLSEIGSQNYLQNQNGLDEKSIASAFISCLED